MRKKTSSGLPSASSVLMIGTLMSLLYILYLVFIVIIFMWLLKLERIECTCALGWKRNYLLFYIIFSVLIIVLNLFNVAVPVVLSGVLSIFGILFIIIAYDYVRKLEKDKCTCSNAFARDLLYGISIVYGLLIIIGVLMIILNISSAKLYSSSR